MRPVERPLVEMSTVSAPALVPVDGALCVVYELALRNRAAASARLQWLEVRDREDAPRPLLRLEGADLESALGVARSRDADDPARIPRLGQAFVHLWLRFEEGAAVPRFLHHRIGAVIEDGRGHIEAEVPPVEVSTDEPAVLGPPLRGGGWRVLNGPSNASIHRRYVALDFREPYLSQRFAVDLVRETEDGRVMVETPEGPRNLAMGAEVLAMADATVAEASDGTSDNRLEEGHRAVELTMRTVAGNHVVLDLGDGRFVFYGHLLEGSVRVSPGDRVARGDVIGLLGNSGNSTEPHLHVHVADGPHAFHAQGLPWVLTAFEVIADRRPGAPARTGLRILELPADGMVLQFLGER